MRHSRMEAGRLCCGRRCLWATTTPTILARLCFCGASWAHGRPNRRQSFSHACRFEDAHGHSLYYLLMDFVDGEVALDADDAAGVTSRDLEILLQTRP